ncbi:hypothetical protein ABE17_10055 [Bacillus mycoides]|nr:hypothetical protein [Bacillus mycoides]
MPFRKKKQSRLKLTLHKLSLIAMWGDPIAIKLRNTVFPKMIKMNFGAIKNTKFPFKEYFKVLA